MNGYAKMHTLDIKAPSDMLETVAGFEHDRRTRAELAFAMNEADANDAVSLRWLACVIDRRLAELDS